MNLALDHQSFRTTSDHVHDVVAQLQSSGDAIGRDVDELLGCWTGAAARSFAEGWEDWRSAASDVRDGLETIGRLLDTVHADLQAQDLAAQGDLHRITAHLTERLG